MKTRNQKPRIAIVSPFLDKQHGTERAVVEWLANLPDRFDIHIYSQRIEDLDPSRFAWHRIPTLSGPHLFNYLWWFAANHAWRAWDRHFRSLQYDLVFSPGINCLDADVISVHIVFKEFLRQVHPQLKLSQNPPRFWLRLLHRRLYYTVLLFLERRVYADEQVSLLLYAKKTVADLKRFYQRSAGCHVLYLGLDHTTYHPSRRTALRGEARRQLSIADARFAVLMIGNDWHKKGIRVLLDAMSRLRDVPVDLFVAGREDRGPFRDMAADRALAERVYFLPPRNDVELYYAAADAYAGPSLEDTFALPPAEAMACGLPVIVSSTNGACEIITNGVDGLILDDPTDSASLAAMIRRLYEDEEFRVSLGAKAAETTLQYTWERNGRDLAQIFEDILRRKRRPTAETVTQES